MKTVAVHQHHLKYNISYSQSDASIYDNRDSIEVVRKLSRFTICEKAVIPVSTLDIIFDLSVVVIFEIACPKVISNNVYSIQKP